MRRRGVADGGAPLELMHFRAPEWPSAQGWYDARRSWRREHQPQSLGELNAWYGPHVVFPPRLDPRHPFGACCVSGLCDAPA